MAQRSAGTVLASLLALGTGAALLWAAVSGSPSLPATLGPLTGTFVAQIAGLMLVAMGLAGIVSVLRRSDQPEPSIPAHVAFVSRTSTPLVAPPKPTRATKPLGPSPDAAQRAMARLDAEIRELTKRINKAGVMLATGKLSREGYAAYVDELKRQRSTLEADRVHMELRK